MSIALTVIVTSGSGADPISSLKRVVHSILANEGEDYELIIVDRTAEGSIHTEIATEVAATVDAAGRDLVHVIVAPEAGSTKATNQAVSQARGSLIAVTDFDCEVSSDWVASIIQAFTVDPKIGLVFGNVYPGKDQKHGRSPSYVRSHPTIVRSVRDKSEAEGIWACMAVRRQVLLDLGGFDEQLGQGAQFPGGADKDLAIRALVAGYWVYENPEASVTHHRSATDSRGVTSLRYTYASGAVLAKHLRCKTPHMFRLLARLVARRIKGDVHPAIAVTSKPRRMRRAIAFVRGFTAGAFTPLDRSSRIFKVQDGKDGSKGALHRRPEKG